MSDGCDPFISYKGSYLYLGTARDRKDPYLTVILQHLISSGRRVLLTSHTNLAVDEILSKYIEDPLTQRYVQDGKIVRYGTLSKNDPALEDLTIDGITNKKAKIHLDKIARIESTLIAVEKSLSYFELASFKSSVQHLDSLKKTVEERKQKLRQLEKEREEIKKKVAEQLKKTTQLKKSLDDLKNAGFFSRMFSGGKAEETQKKIDASVQQHVAYKEKQDSLEVTHVHGKKALSLSEGVVNTAESNIRKKAKEANINLPVTISTASLPAHKRPLTEKILGYNDEIRELRAKIDAISDSVLKGAAVVGCTLAKLYTDSHLHSDAFDVMILDEASMAQLPAVYFAAGLTRESHYIVSGDFRQLSPISQCSKECAKMWLLRSIFDQAGIAYAANNGIPDTRLVMLDEQFRMHPGIAALINGPMYQGMLKTGKVIIPQKQAIAACSPFEDKPVVLVDTSSLNPWSKKPGKSKINLYHAMIATELTKQILAGGISSVGIIAPYKAQSELITTMLENAGIPNEKAMAATVHKFQGNERECVIYDTVEGEGTGTRFMQGGWTDSEAGRLLNVAISRAEGKFIKIANTRYCANNFGPEDAMVGLIQNLQDSGFVVEPQDVLPQNDNILVSDIGTELSLADVSECSLWDEHSFYPLFAQEVRKAKENIVIFSPFMTKYRISQLMDDFRQAISRGVRIVCMVREPKDQGSLANVQDTHTLADECRRVGIEMVTPAQNRNLSQNFHEKIAFFDKSLVFYGSLNILSQNDSTESMMAMCKPQIVEEMWNKFMVNMYLVPIVKSGAGKSSASDKANATKLPPWQNNSSDNGSTRSGSKVSSEHPRSEDAQKRSSSGKDDEILSVIQKHLTKPGSCPVCGSPMHLMKENNAFFLICEKNASGCRGEQAISFSLVQTASRKAQISCSKCSSGTLTLRDGKYGPFLGCSAYPECRNIVNIR